jgi:hypothetical protein
MLCVTDFQQNSFAAESWAVPPGGAILVQEVDEATADMFLNWVYRHLFGTSTGFKNQSWQGIPCLGSAVQGTDDSDRTPGDRRYEWMQEEMQLLFQANVGWR